MNMSIEQDVSIIVPTYREATNVMELVKRIAHANLGERNHEVIFVDDNSQDGIIDLVNDLANQYPWLKIMIRKGPRCLSQAVIDGFQHASYPILLCMDADLSHPPEKIADMLNALADPTVDFVIGSRYIRGGSTDESWPVYRKFSSRCAAFLANLLIFSHSQVKDPLSGFFALRKKTFLSGTNLNPIGWKIGLEMMVKLRCKKIQEIPIHFSERHHGQSKFSLKVTMNYLQHIRKLLWFKLARNGSE